MPLGPFAAAATHDSVPRPVEVEPNPDYTVLRTKIVPTSSTAQGWPSAMFLDTVRKRLSAAPDLFPTSPTPVTPTATGRDLGGWVHLHVAVTRQSFANAPGFGTVLTNAVFTSTIASFVTRRVACAVDHRNVGMSFFAFRPPTVRTPAEDLHTVVGDSIGRHANPSVSSVPTALIKSIGTLVGQLQRATVPTIMPSNFAQPRHSVAPDSLPTSPIPELPTATKRGIANRVHLHGVVARQGLASTPGSGAYFVGAISTSELVSSVAHWVACAVAHSAAVLHLCASRPFTERISTEDVTAAAGASIGWHTNPSASSAPTALRKGIGAVVRQLRRATNPTEQSFRDTQPRRGIAPDSLPTSPIPALPTAIRDGFGNRVHLHGVVTPQGLTRATDVRESTAVQLACAAALPLPENRDQAKNVETNQQLTVPAMQHTTTRATSSILMITISSPSSRSGSATRSARRSAIDGTHTIRNQGRDDDDDNTMANG